jgi:hypothetical protein
MRERSLVQSLCYSGSGTALRSSREPRSINGWKTASHISRSFLKSQRTDDNYGWPHTLSDDQILEHLLARNLERAAGQE